LIGAEVDGLSSQNCFAASVVLTIMALGLVLAQPSSAAAPDTVSTRVQDPSISKRVWFVGGGAGLVVAELSPASGENTWVGLSGGVHFGRVVSDKLRIAVEIGLQSFSIFHFDPVFGSSGPDDTLELLTLTGSVYLHPNWEPIPLLGLLSVFGGAFVRADAGYTRLIRVEGVDDGYDQQGRLVETFDRDKDGVCVLGGLGWDAELDGGWSVDPQLAVEYHKFSGWHILGVTFDAYLNLRF